jgi:hypothetical protein
MPEPWRYTTVLDFLDHWQAIIAGVLGFSAGIIAVLITLGIERRRVAREADALRKSIATELRLMVSRALGVFNLLDKYIKDASTPITGRMVRYLTRVPTPVIFPANADKIGLLGSDAMEAVIFYAFIEVGREGAKDLERDYAENRIPTDSLAVVARSFLTACNQAVILLPALQTGDPKHAEKDAEVIRTIKRAFATMNANPTTSFDHEH